MFPHVAYAPLISAQAGLDSFANDVQTFSNAAHKGSNLVLALPTHPHGALSPTSNEVDHSI